MVLVTGGTGLVGSHLLFRLMDKGYTVRAIYRKNSNLDQVKKLFSCYSDSARELFQKIDWIEAELNDIPALEEAFTGVTHVYHCAALISFDPKSYRKLQKVNTRGTTNIVNLCLSNSAEKLCYVSTIGTIGKSLNGTKSNEETEWMETEANVYALTKYAAEMEVWRGSQEGLSVVIVNPGIIIGPASWNRGSGALFTTANRAYSYYPPGGTGFVTVNDVVRMMMQLMESSLSSERYIAVAENLTYHQILNRITQALGVNPPRKKLQFWQLEIFRLFDSVWCGITGNERKMTKNSMRSLRNRQIFDNQKAMDDLNFEFEDLSETIQFTADRFLNDS
ncbi:MAG: NAD-dependent epimerase/dehydratase family protein [Aurantibacter sp.]